MSINSFGIDINQLGTSQYPRTSYEVAPVYFTGIVEDVILNDKNGKVLQYKPDGSNIGEILVRIIPDDREARLEDLKSAFPLETNIQSYPLKGEQVIVYKILGTRFYSRSIASTRKVSQNEWSLMRNIFSKRDTELDTQERELARAGSPLTDVFQNIRNQDANSVGDEYKTNRRARMVRASEGDVIIQGRFGNVVRFGSSLFKESTGIPQPNILLTAGLWESPSEVSTPRKTRHSLVYENLDKDASSIWMVSDQKVEFTAATQLSPSNPKAHLLSSPKKTANYTGAQIFVNSDRVIVNSKKNEISLFSNSGINLSALGAIALDTENSIFLRSFADVNIKANNSLYLEANDITIKANSLSYKTPGDYIIQGKRVFIGRYAVNMEPMVLGRSLASFLQNVLQELENTNERINDILTSIIPVIPGAAATTTAPITAAKIQLGLSKTKLKALLSGTTPGNAIFNSTDNFTAKTNV